MSTLSIQTIPSTLTHIKQLLVAKQLRLAKSDALPKGFPVMIKGNAVWVGPDFANKDTYIYYLSDPEICEICQSLDAFKDLGLDGTKINKSNFLLPTLGPKLHTISQEVHTGRGFAVVRGLDPARFCVEDLSMIYMGIGSHIADTIGRQDRNGNALVHIVADKNNRAHHRHSTDPITFHTEDCGDVVAWLTRNVAADGGRCVISSAATVYNVLSAVRPDLIRVLAAGNWPFALPRYQCRPILFHENGKILFNFGRAPLLGSSANPRKAHLPGLSPQQQEALDVIEAIARATEFGFQTQPGDIHFISNMTVLHRRDGFTDNGDHSRHLVRTLLTDSVHGSKVPALERQWTEAFGEEGNRAFHIEPMPGFFPLRKYPN